MFDVIGIERLTIDYFAPDWEGSPEDGLGDLVNFVDKAGWSSLGGVSTAALTTPRGGGCVANALIALSRFLRYRGVQKSLAWSGSASTDGGSSVALRELTEAGIHLIPEFRCSGSTQVVWKRVLRGALHENNLMIHKGSQIPDSTWQCYPAHRVLIGLDSILDGKIGDADLPRLNESRVSMLLNSKPFGLDERGFLQGLVSSGCLEVVCGTAPEVDAFLGLLEAAGTTLSTETILIRTRGAHGVTMAWKGTVHALPAATISPMLLVDTLGAGDTVFGVFIAGLMLGLDLKTALHESITWASKCLQHEGARPGREVLVQEFCPDLQSILAGELAKIRDDMDLGAGIALLSGGQTGIDEIIGGVGKSFGVPTYYVFPRSFMREDGVEAGMRMLREGFPRCFELSSESYKTRTWATAWLGDATLLFDFCDSSGSIECRTACSHLNRLLVEDALDRKPRELAEFLVDRGVRVINVAGNRGSRLSPENRTRVEVYLNAFAQSFAFVNANREKGTVRHRPWPDTWRDLVIGVPSSGPMATILWRLLSSVFSLPEWNPKQAVFKSPKDGVTVVRGRVRDMAQWLEDGLVGLAIGGHDDFLEGGGDLAFHHLGLFNSSILMLGKAGVFGARDPIYSQFPEISKRLLEGCGLPWRMVEPIQGMAETWLELRGHASCIDTWHTGASARLNGLQPVARLGETDTCIAWNRAQPDMEDMAHALASGMFGSEGQNGLQ